MWQGGPPAGDQQQNRRDGSLDLQALESMPMWARVRCAATSRTRQPAHRDGTSHSSAARSSGRSARLSRSSSIVCTLRRGSSRPLPPPQFETAASAEREKKLAPIVETLQKQAWELTHPCGEMASEERADLTVRARRGRTDPGILKPLQKPGPLNNADMVGIMSSVLEPARHPELLTRRHGGSQETWLVRSLMSVETAGGDVVPTTEH